MLCTCVNWVGKNRSSEISSLCVFRNDVQTQDGFEIRSEEKTSLIMEWLGLGTTVFQQRETETAYVDDGKAFSASVLLKTL